MFNANPFRQPGQWYRGNTHSHSTESDGQLPMSERFGAYREAGYDFLVLTDHRKVNDVSAYSTSDFLAISGSEVHPSNPYGGATYHFVAINIHETLNCAKMHPNAVLDEINKHRAVKPFYVIRTGRGIRLQIIYHYGIISRLKSITIRVWASVKVFPSRHGMICWIEAAPFSASPLMMRMGPNTTASTAGLW